MTGPKDPVPARGEVLVYPSEDGAPQVHVQLVEGTVWPSQKQIAALYGEDVRTINEHLGNVYEEEELDPAATSRKVRLVQSDEARSASWTNKVLGRLCQRTGRGCPSRLGADGEGPREGCERRRNALRSP